MSAASGTPRSATGQVVLYVVLALGLTWLVWIPAFVVSPEPPLPVVVLGAFGPAVAAAVMVRRGGGSIRRWVRDVVVVRAPARWYGFALAVPLLIAGVQTLAAVLAGVSLSPEVLPLRALSFVVSVALVFLFGGGQEEPGWRGYLLPALQSRASPLAASVVVGLVWVAWHLPLFVFGYEQYASTNLALYVPTLLGLSVVLTVLWNRSGGSLIVVMLLHALVNSAGGLVPIAEADGSALQQSLLAQLATPVVVLALAAFLVARYGTGLGGPIRPPAGVVRADAGRATGSA